MLFTSRTYFTFLLGCLLPSLCMTTPVLPRNQTSIVDSAKVVASSPSSLLDTRELEETLERRQTAKAKYLDLHGAVALDPAKHGTVKYALQQLIAGAALSGHPIGMPSSPNEIDITGTPVLAPARPLPIPNMPHARMVFCEFTTDKHYLGVVTENMDYQFLVWKNQNGEKAYMGYRSSPAMLDKLKAAEILSGMPGGTW